jgi:L-asparaginase
MTPKEWDRILDVLKKEYKNWDGFVITHGTDTMAYTASALSIAIKNLGKPIVITGSQISGVNIENDARRNFINAIKLATMNIRGVYIVFDERIIEGYKATKSSESKLDAFSTVNDIDLGEIRLNIEFNKEVPRRKHGNIKIEKGFESDIFIYTLTPGCDPTDLEFLLKNERIKGLIIRAFGTGNIPDNFKTFFEKSREKKLPIVVASQCIHGETRMNSYEVGNIALKNNIMEGKKQSLELLTVKLMWAIKHIAYQDIKNFIQETTIFY